MPNQPHRATWLTIRRLRAHGFLLAIALWTLYAWTLATPGLRDRNGNLKGTDFLHFYTLGSLAIERRGADLYDMAAQSTLATDRVPGAAGIQYLPLYPPQVSIFFALLARFSYAWALAAWWIESALIYAACCYAVWRACPKLEGHGATVALLAIAFPGFFNLIAWGQTSALALGCLTLNFLLLRKRRDFLAGLALGYLIFKPQLGIAAAIVFVAMGAWRVVAGAILSAAAELSVGVLYYGVEALRTWMRALSNIRSTAALLEPRAYQTHCLRTFWSMIVPWSGVSLTLYAVSSVAVLGVTIAIWRTRSPLSLRYSALLLSTVLISPHLTVYDLLILAPAFLLLADWLLSNPVLREARVFGALLYMAYVLPLLASLTRWTRVQLSVLAMTALLYFIWKASEPKRVSVAA
jgi:hypothetical protein